MVRKFISVFLLALFMAYSGGIGFLLRTCNHCNEVKINFFYHAECCSASKETKHCGETCANEEQTTPSCCSENCSHDNIPEIYTMHPQQCCVFEFMFFKINSYYVSSQYENIFQPDTYYSLVLFDLLQQENKPLLNRITEDKILPEKIPPLIPGGERFIIYAHQLLFYA
ncbi:MAG: hypothetical protein LBG80_01095 [Bacteroidales bacterium]|nr:hypothetical protein [Bacteroidales bacterium]